MVVTSKMNSASLPPARPDSEQLVDLHVYRVPPDVWNDKYQSAYNEVINETISIGFVREELRNQLGPASLPEEFVYVRSVGRCLTQVKGRQELELKVKAFLPPRNFAPEIFILEGEQDVPDTAFIEATKEVAVSTMEVDEEESMEEKGTASRKAKKVAFKGTADSSKTVKTKLPSRNLKGLKAVISDKNSGKPAVATKSSHTTKAGGSERSKAGQTMTMTELKALQKRETDLKKSGSNKLTPRVGKTSVLKGPAVDKNAKASTTLKGSEVSNVRQVRGRETHTKSLTSRVSQKTGKPSNLKVKQQGNKKGGTPGHVTFTSVKDGKEVYKYKQGQRHTLPKEYRRDNISARQAPSTVSHKAQLSNQNPSLPLLQPHSNQPPVALLSPSPHPPSNAHSYPTHPEESTPVTLPQAVMSHPKNPSRSQVSLRRQASQSRMISSSSSQAISMKRHEMDISSNRRVISRKESENSSFSIDKGLSSHGQQSSQRTYSQTTEETLPGFSSMSESQQSETSPSYTSVTLPTQKSSLKESSSVTENDQMAVGQDRSSSRIRNISNPHLAHPSNPHPFSHINDESLHAKYSNNTPKHSNQHSKDVPHTDNEPVHLEYPINTPNKSMKYSNHVSHTNNELAHSEYPILTPNHSNPDEPLTPVDDIINPPDVPSPFTNSPTNHLRPDDNSRNINNALPILPVLSSHAPTHPVSDSEREPQLTTPSATHGLSKLQSPRKETRQDTFTKNTNSDSGLGEQTPEDTQERILRGSEGPQTFERNGDSFRQDHHANQYEGVSKSRAFAGADKGQGHHNLYQEDSPRSYQQNQNFPSRTQREDWGPQPHPIHRDPSDYYSDRGPQGGQSAMHQVHGTYQDLSPRGGNYEQRNRPADSLTNQEKLFTPRTQRDEGVIQDRGYHPHFSGGTTSRYSDNMRNQQGHPYSYDDSRGPIDQADDTQEAMAYLQLSNEGTIPHDKQQQRYGSPSDLDSQNPISPEKQRLLNQIREEQQERLEMEKMREELIKKAKNLQGKTIDRRKKDGMTEMLQARDYWKKRYYDEKKKTPSLEEQVAKLASQVQQQNRKLMHHLEGKGAKAPKGPPSKRMDHKIQIFKHQHDMEDIKRQVDNARMKLATEIKLRTQAETELRVLKSEVIQKKINVTLKRGKQLQAIQKSEEKSQGRTPLPKGAGGSSI
ncbi:Spermatogenesis-associated protein 1 [Holothuria leucospilota]|uniref:Spermatogenesis-associated protein 1 n=1 Tax=Holothuria leucospilota TaxID=206669 RepID=A0A9Q1HBY2_HOLLE|nr:Spermatogenesis-associated protein 1 [Holothuria leucospilota]